MREIELIELSSRVTPGDLLARLHSGKIVACDFYVEGIEHGQEVVGGYRMGRIFNVDHHAPTPRMQRRVSSTNLALERMQADLPPLDTDALIVINHLDCDSILSAGILSGRLGPDPRFGEAAIAADHTGAEDEIADLLQGIDAELSRQRVRVRDLELPFRSLEQHLARGTLNPFARKALDARRRDRDEAERLIGLNKFQKAGPLLFAVMDEPIDGEFFPALIPGAVAIMIAYPLPADTSRWQVKLRLGLAATQELSLFDLGIREFDPQFGGRWNAGSNGRDEVGTTLTPEEYAEELARRLIKQLSIASGS